MVRRRRSDELRFVFYCLFDVDDYLSNDYLLRLHQIRDSAQPRPSRQKSPTKSRAMRSTINLCDALMERAKSLTGTKETVALVR